MNNVIMGNNGYFQCSYEIVVIMEILGLLSFMNLLLPTLCFCRPCIFAYLQRKEKSEISTPLLHTSQLTPDR